MQGIAFVDVFELAVDEQIIGVNDGVASYSGDMETELAQSLGDVDGKVIDCKSAKYALALDGIGIRRLLTEDPLIFGDVDVSNGKVRDQAATRSRQGRSARQGNRLNRALAACNQHAWQNQNKIEADTDLIFGGHEPRPLDRVECPAMARI